MSLVANGSGTFVWCSAIPTHDPGDYGAKFAVQTNTLTWYHHVTGTTWEEIGPIGLQFPLLAPNGSEATPSYGFENHPDGLFHDGTFQIKGSAGGVQLYTIDEEDDPGDITIQGGDSLNSQGGEIVLRSGNGAVGGPFTMSGGQSSLPGEFGGLFTIQGGNNSAPEEGYGGFVAIKGGDASGPFSQGGNVGISGGAANVGGSVTIAAGNIDFAAVSWGRVALRGPIDFEPITSAQRDLMPKGAGTTVFVSNAVANDGSTGVMQTYNGTTWKNHW